MAATTGLLNTSSIRAAGSPGDPTEIPGVPGVVSYGNIATEVPGATRSALSGTVADGATIWQGETPQASTAIASQPQGYNPSAWAIDNNQTAESTNVTAPTGYNAANWNVTANQQATAAAVARPTGYTAEQWGGNAADQLVESRINNLTSSGSPLMQQAAARGAALANRRGLLSSSMAARAAQGAVFDAALPIAQSDAEAYRRVAEANMNATNAQRAQTAALLSQTDLSNADAATRVALANASTQAQAAAANQAAQNTERGQTAALTSTANLANAEAANRAALANASAYQQAAQTNAAAANAEAAQQATLNQQTELANAGAMNQTSQFNAEQLRQQRASEIDQYMRQITQIADNELKTYMADLEANYKTLMQSDATISSLMSNYLRSIADIQSSANLDQAGKTAAIANLQTAIQDAIELQDGITGLDLGAIFAPELAPDGNPFAVAPAPAAPPPPSVTSTTAPRRVA